MTEKTAEELAAEAHTAAHVAAAKSEGGYDDAAWDALSDEDRQVVLDAVPAPASNSAPDSAPAGPPAAETPEPGKPAKGKKGKPGAKASASKAPASDAADPAPEAADTIVEMATSRFGDTEGNQLQRFKYARTTAARAARFAEKGKVILVSEEAIASKGLVAADLPEIG